MMGQGFSRFVVFQGFARRKIFLPSRPTPRTPKATRVRASLSGGIFAAATIEGPCFTNMCHAREREHPEYHDAARLALRRFRWLPGLGGAQKLASRRDRLALPVIASEAKQSTVPPPAARGFGRASSTNAASPCNHYYATGFGNSSAEHLVDGWIASLRSQ